LNKSHHEIQKDIEEGTKNIEDKFHPAHTKMMHITPDNLTDQIKHDKIA